MISALFEGFSAVLRDVAVALTPLVVVFVFFQIFLLKLPKRHLIKIVKGIILTFAGLALFLQGVHVGFLPVGELMGMTIGSLDYNWILIPIGFLMGFAVIMAEPAVQVLAIEVEKASSGHINKKIMIYTLCIGVAFSVALSMIRVLTGISLWYFIVPGYIIALLMTKYVSSEFVAIAFDAGGAATGPMTVTFILSMTVGVAKQLEGRNPLMDGFGMVSLVALTPILSILILGVLYSRKEKLGDERRTYSGREF
ncbi:DUF1538 domain-containing protein [Thermosediminibacter oceani]|uniref:DUF1538 domain-containing protein n=1 Tax=Thermosediminibacter oceani (strain ATCC BAA-1034 / DSM 16646 / JW/IW-1228P) TaxID=555079 RepID=D9S1U8_THEOJ|nr:DUF1538 domain-containing protein [Thermosediminibacter oceani]ADL07375.1 protein of unknown function DUF1538 [Thermosediminibacter oceani DSM 16646]